MRKGQEAARRFHEEPERSSDFLCLPDLEDFLFCLRKKKKKRKNSTFGKKSGNGPLLFPNKRKLIFSKNANEHLSVVRVAIGEDVMVVAAEITSLGSFRSGDQERGS